MSFQLDSRPTFSENSLSVVPLADANATLTAKQFASGIFVIAPTLERTITLPSAASLVAAEGSALTVGCGRKFYFRNDGVSAVNVAVGPGGSLNGSGTVAVGTFASHFYIRFSNITPGSEAYDIIRI